MNNMSMSFDLRSEELYDETSQDCKPLGDIINRWVYKNPDCLGAIAESGTKISVSTEACQKLIRHRPA